MKSEDDPITDDEIVLRLIWRDFYKDGDPLTVKPRAFHPRDNETTGISVFRLACLTSPSDALRAISDPEKRAKYLIAAIPVSELKTLGITVTPDRIECVAGHAVLSELNSDSWGSDKPMWLPKVESLAILAGQSVSLNPNQSTPKPDPS